MFEQIKQAHKYIYRYQNKIYCEKLFFSLNHPFRDHKCIHVTDYIFTIFVWFYVCVGLVFLPGF